MLSPEVKVSLFIDSPIINLDAFARILPIRMSRIELDTQGLLSRSAFLL